MIKHITHAGVNHVDSIIKPNHPTLLISILDATSPLQRPDFSQFHNVLSLTFKDRCEEDYGFDDLWPDEPNDMFNFGVLRVADERLFSLSDAERVVDFFETHHAQEQEFDLIAHCKSGVGRSAAIAEFFGIVHNIPYRGTDPDGRFMPNCRVTRLLTKAYHNKYPYADQRSNKTNVYELGLPERCYITSGL